MLSAANVYKFKVNDFNILLYSYAIIPRKKVVFIRAMNKKITILIKG